MKKLNAKGFAHWVMPVLVVGVVAAVGAYVLSASHADAPTQGPPYNTPYLTITSPMNSFTFDRTSQNANLLPPGSSFNGLDVFQTGFTITNRTALAYSIPNYSISSTKGGLRHGANPELGIFNPSGRLQPGQTTNIVLYINPNSYKNGVYDFEAQLNYLVPATPSSPQHWATAPPIQLSATLTGRVWQDYLSISTTKVTVGVSRSHVDATSGLVLSDPITLTSNTVMPLQLQTVNKTGTGQVSLYPSTLSLDPHQVKTIQLAVNPDQPDGIYSGSITLQYQNEKQRWVNGPTITYTVNVTD